MVSQSIEPRLMEVGRILQLSRLQMVFKIALPSCMPDIFAAMRLALIIALILSVVGRDHRLSGWARLAHPGGLALLPLRRNCLPAWCCSG